MSDKPSGRDILVLGLIALITALFVGFAAFVVAILAGWLKPWAWGLGGFAVSGVITWVSLLGWSGRLLQAVNGVSPTTMLGDESHQNYDLTINYNDGWAGDRLGLGEIGIDIERFYQFLEGCARGKSLGENHWTGRGNLFAKSEFHRLRNLLIERGYLVARGRYHAQGFEWGRKGISLLNRSSHRIVQDNHSPTTRVLAGSFDNFIELCEGERASVSNWEADYGYSR